MVGIIVTSLITFTIILVTCYAGFKILTIVPNTSNIENRYHNTEATGPEDETELKDDQQNVDQGSYDLPVRRENDQPSKELENDHPDSPKHKDDCFHEVSENLQSDSSQVEPFGSHDDSNYSYNDKPQYAEEDFQGSKQDVVSPPDELNIFYYDAPLHEESTGTYDEYEVSQGAPQNTKNDGFQDESEYFHSDSKQELVNPPDELNIVYNDAPLHEESTGTYDEYKYSQPNALQHTENGEFQDKSNNSYCDAPQNTDTEDDYFQDELENFYSDPPQHEKATDSYNEYKVGSPDTPQNAEEDYFKDEPDWFYSYSAVGSLDELRDFFCDEPQSTENDNFLIESEDFYSDSPLHTEDKSLLIQSEDFFLDSQ